MQFQPGCDASIDYRPEGLLCELVLPAEEIVEVPAPAPPLQ